MSASALDDLDRALIERLTLDVRVSNREIGREMNLTEGAIRARLKRLFDDEVIRVVAVTNANRLRNPFLAYLWIEAETSADIQHLAAALAELPEIGFVSTTLGRADILAMTLVENGRDLTDYLHQTIDKIPGVRRVRYSLGQTFIKHDLKYCILTP
ncbi:MAG: Lrp/AsnC family transcriptional regulator [Brevundimonas sp.]|uniref:Lrp/AsnC family transcriptional regulator n=1 Tax=Brevundimonas sp. TaxID=1871086 RepID=UPI000DB4C8F9|nr:Lrp/AsnC family transcriptional regulator [Brevundimonas sp.]PZU00304.1 MAG: Lrp/AsnC family transcriptional regulator [Brevundimonas sp.]